MWQVYTRRRRIKWLAIGVMLLMFTWGWVLYRSLSLTDQEDVSPHIHTLPKTSGFPFLYEMENIDAFIKHTPVKYNYHVFYYPW